MAVDQGNITTPNAADLNTAARKYAASQGWAMPDGSYPIRPLNMHGAADLDKAVHAVGRGGGSHADIRAHIIKRAKALGLSNRVPNDWNGGGMNALPSGDVERRYTLVPVEVRAGAGTDRMTIGGYAAKFYDGTPATMSQNLGGFKERIAPGTFNRSRSNGWQGVLARYNHDDSELLGTTGAGSLRLGIDDIGLLYDVDINQEDTRATNVYARVKRGDVRQSSFAFIADDEEWAADDTGFPMRTLVQARLIDVAPVNSPAYVDTSVGLRSLARRFDAPLEEVRAMADANELRKFFVVTGADGGAPTARRSAHAALAKAMSM